MKLPFGRVGVFSAALIAISAAGAIGFAIMAREHPPGSELRVLQNDPMASWTPRQVVVGSEARTEEGAEKGLLKPRLAKIRRTMFVESAEGIVDAAAIAAEEAGWRIESVRGDSLLAFRSVTDSGTDLGTAALDVVATSATVDGRARLVIQLRKL